MMSRYIISARGKSVPEWMSSEARRKLERGNLDARRRIQLIQDFDMPDVSHTINITPDGKYVFASGSYKPFIKCYDLSNLSLKFERGLDADVIKMIVLSEDFSKLVILEQERYIEMHATFGRYFRMRMPCYGRDMAYSTESSDLFLVGAKKDIYRLNLEQGEWLTPLESTAPAINCCQVAKEHQLLVCGTSKGCVEAFDPRDKTLCGILDCATPISQLLGEASNAEVTAIAFADALQIGVGTSTGHVLLFDIRSRRPLLIKDHKNELAIKKIDFVKRDEGNVVASMDSRMLKLWHQEDGEPFAAIENEKSLNDFARFPDSGLFFFANEAQRMLQYFLPAIGPAPKWCSYLDSITEELEETEPSVYDNYKFVTKKQLEELGLNSLEGTNLLRAYMHGYFIDSRLYDKAKLMTQPFAYENYKAEKIKSIMEKERDQEVIKKKKEKLPAVNSILAARLREEAVLDTKKAASAKEKREKKRAEIASSLLADDRFKKLFESADYEVDEASEQFERNAAVAKKLAERAPRRVEEDDEDSEGSESEEEEEEDSDDDDEGPSGMSNARPLWLEDEDKVRSDEMDSDIESRQGSESDEDDVKKQKQKQKLAKRAEAEKRRLEKLEARRNERELLKETRLATKPKKFVLHSIGASETTRKFIDEKLAETSEGAGKQESLSLDQRNRVSKKFNVAAQNEDKTSDAPFGGREMKFTIGKRASEVKRDQAKAKKASHVAERQSVTRRPNSLVTKGLKKLPSNLNLGRKKDTNVQ
ncbi:unnamed protein product [Caenorhabditis auriculariae]|uniref:NUC153 domain-containing protein n=1 Tax=Caenorhabditis auriculariae TaxID=2777116 RepID=A0A8S1HCJ2_9PELO|nr:unnamed protein product [Caenorhabditis auriculariae]